MTTDEKACARELADMSLAYSEPLSDYSGRKLARLSLDLLDELDRLQADRDKQFNEVTRLLTIFMAAITDIRAGLPEDAFDTLCRGTGIDPDKEGMKDEKFRRNNPQ